jgi:hypothetical protein
MVLMLNRTLKKDGLQNYEHGVERYDMHAQRVREKPGCLHTLREGSAQGRISAYEACVNIGANAPKEFEKNVGDLEVGYGKFAQLLANLRRENATHEGIGRFVVGTSVSGSRRLSKAEPVAIGVTCE